MKVVIRNFLFCILMLVSTNLFAQQPIPTYVGIRSDKVEYFVSSQRTNMWCWAACIQTVLNYYDVSLTQEDIVFRTFGADNWGRLPTAGGNAQIITQHLNGWSIDRDGDRYEVSARLYRGSPSPIEIIEHLRQEKPIILAYGATPDTGHVVVVTAVSYILDPWRNPLITSIIVRDPYPTPMNIQTRGRIEYPNGSLPNVVQWVWLVEARSF